MNVRPDPDEELLGLIGALNGEVIEGSGPRARFDLNDVSLNIHSPHLRPELKIYQVKAVRDFLTQAGIAR